MYRALADVVVVVHFGYLAFVAVGGLLAWRWRHLVVPHLAAVALAIASIGVGFDCPLTGLEKRLRRWAGDTPYGDGFVDHYITGTLYPRGHERLAQVVIAVVLLAGYGAFILRRDGASAPPRRARWYRRRPSRSIRVRS